MLRSYTAADALTIGNAASGTLAILLCLAYVGEQQAPLLWGAFALLPVALSCDLLVLTYFVVCGVSRPTRFNVTSAALADAATGKVKYFEGTPIPTSIVIVALLAVAFATGQIDDRLWLGAVRLGPATLHPLVLVYAASGSAMISATLRIPKL